MMKDIAETRLARIKPVLDAVQSVIDAAGNEGIPSGHLYAMLMSHMDLDTYQSLINIMVDAGGITIKNHVIRAAH